MREKKEAQGGYKAPSLKVYGGMAQLTASGTSGQTENMDNQDNKSPPLP